MGDMCHFGHGDTEVLANTQRAQAGLLPTTPGRVTAPLTTQQLLQQDANPNPKENVYKNPTRPVNEVLFRILVSQS